MICHDIIYFKEYKMSYYGNNYPEIDEVVYVKITSFSEHGIYCSLIEYNDKEGFLRDSELDKKIYYDKKKYFNYKKVYPMMVTDIDFDKNHIDLSHKKIKSDERDKHIKYFDFVSKMYRLTAEFSKLSNIEIDDLLPLTMWQYIQKDNIESSQKKFKTLLERPDQFIDHTKLTYPSESTDFLDNISSRITSTTMTIHQNFDMTVYCDDAVNEICNILSFDLLDNVKIEYVNAPTYRFVVECKFDDNRDNLIHKYIEIHNQKIKNKMCNHNDYVKLGNDISIDEINLYINEIRNRIKDKKIHFELGDMLLIKEREISIKYLSKYDIVDKSKNIIWEDDE